MIRESENERLRFDLRVGLEILRREAKYRAEEPTRQGIFLYQFESLCRHRLGYDRGLEAIAGDPAFDETWRDWILKLRRQIGMVDTGRRDLCPQRVLLAAGREVGAGNAAAGSREASTRAEPTRP